MPEQQKQRHATGLSVVVLIAMGVAFAAVIALHVLRTDLSPVREVMSLYANGDFGDLMNIAFYALAVGAIALGIRLLFITERGIASRTTSVLLWLAGSGLILAGLFEVELPGVPDTINETLHSDGAIAGFVLVIAAMVSFSFVCHREQRWHSFLRVDLAFITVSILGAAFSPFAPHTAIAGIAQRVLALAVFGWVITLAAWIRFKPELQDAPSDGPS